MSCGGNCNCKTKKVENPIMRYFAWGHLPFGHLQDISRKVSELATAMERDLPEGPEKSAGLRKLLEAKDCFVRAALEIESQRILKENHNV